MRERKERCTGRRKTVLYWLIERRRREGKEFTMEWEEKEERVKGVREE